MGAIATFKDVSKSTVDPKLTTTFGWTHINVRLDTGAGSDNFVGFSRTAAAYRLAPGESVSLWLPPNTDVYAITQSTSDVRFFFTQVEQPWIEEIGEVVAWLRRVASALECHPLANTGG